MTKSTRHLIRQYYHLQEKIDRESERLLHNHGSIISCKPGCSSCCKLSSVLAIEAIILQRAFYALSKQLQEQIKANISDEFCPLLVNNRCALYQHRPLICRTHGLPIGYIDEEVHAIEISACDLNFPPTYAFTEDNILLMDPFTQQLHTLNAMVSSKSKMRIKILELISAPHPFPIIG